MSVHQEIPIKLTAWIDQGVVPLVEALDGFEDVLTVASCEDDGIQGAYVLFRLRGTSDQATGFASGLAADLNSEEGVSYLLQAEWRPGESEPLLDTLVSTGSGAACSEPGQLRPDEGVVGYGLTRASATTPVARRLRVPSGHADPLRAVARHRNGLLEGRPVLERRRRDRERRGDDRAVLVVAARAPGRRRSPPGRRASAASPSSASAQRLAQRIRHFACEPPPQYTLPQPPRGARAEEVAQVLGDVAPPAVEEVRRRGLSPRVWSPTGEHRPGAARRAPAEGRLELGADQLRPPGVHQRDRARHLVVTVSVQVAAMAAAARQLRAARSRCEARRTAGCRPPGGSWAGASPREGPRSRAPPSTGRAGRGCILRSPRDLGRTRSAISCWRWIGP